MATQASLLNRFPMFRRAAMGRPRLELGMRAWLVWLVIVASLPLAAFSVLTLLELGEAQRQTVMASLVRRTNVAAGAVEQRLGRASASLTALAASPAALANDLAALHEHARRLLLTNPDAIAIALIGPGGEQVFNTLRPFGAANPPTGSPEADREVFATGRPVVSGLFTVGEQAVVSVGVPVYLEGRVAYCLGMVLVTGAFNAVLESLELPRDWTATILDPAGTIIGRSRTADRFAGRRAPVPLLDAMRKGDRDTFASITMEGTPVQAAVVKVPSWAWLVTVAVPKATLDEPVRRSLLVFTLAAAAFVFAGAAAALLLARRLSAQVRAAAKAAEALRNNEQPSLPWTGIRELNELGEALGVIDARERRTNIQLSNAVVAQQQATAELSVARRDALTGLAGRALFLELADKMRAQAAREGERRLAVLFIDLDGFKEVNDTLGHERGDQVLIQTADILRELVREADIAGRLGGDEFVVCVSAPRSVLEGTAVSIAARVVRRVGEIGDGIGCSIGISIWPGSCPDVACALRRADEAMYEAKRCGKNRYVVFGEQAKRDGAPWSEPVHDGCHC